MPDPLSELIPTTQIVGEAVAGETAKRIKEVKKELVRLTEVVQDSTFDQAELISEMKHNSYYGAWGYDSFNDCVEDLLDMKPSKARYLARIVDVTKQLSNPLAEYEDIKITKLREITSLKPEGTFYNAQTGQNEPLADHIRSLIKQANDLTIGEVRLEIARLKGQTGENALVHHTLVNTESAWQNVISPVFEECRKVLGSKGKDEDGEAVEYPDGAVLEKVCAMILSQPNFFQVEDGEMPQTDPDEPPPNHGVVI